MPEAKHYYGFTLLELMLVLVLSAILLIGLLGIYSNLKSFYDAQTTNLNAQENMRFAAYILRQNISIAGYAGCAKLNNLQLANHVDIDFNLTSSIEGFTSKNLPSFLIDKNVAPNTDVLVLQKADADEVRILNAVKNGSKTLRAYKNPATKDNRILLLSNCETADLFRAKNYAGDAKIISTTAFKYNYASGTSVVSRYTEQAYFIGDTGRTNAHDGKIYALYRVVNQGDKEELINGISSMKIKYYVAGEYYAADYLEGNNLWDKVDGVMITLTLQNFEVRQPDFMIYIKLRNRG